jgi:hypothetical protein
VASQSLRNPAATHYEKIDKNFNLSFMQTGVTIHQNEPKLKLPFRFQCRFPKINFIKMFCVLLEMKHRDITSPLYIHFMYLSKRQTT